MTRLLNFQQARIDESRELGDPYSALRRIGKGPEPPAEAKPKHRVLTRVELEYIALAYEEGIPPQSMARFLDINRHTIYKIRRRLIDMGRLDESIGRRSRQR